MLIVWLAENGNCVYGIAIPILTHHNKPDGRRRGTRNVLKGFKLLYQILQNQQFAAEGFIYESVNWVIIGWNMLCGAKPSPDSMVIYCPLEHSKHKFQLHWNETIKMFLDEIHFEASSAKCRPFYVGLNV